MHEHVAHAMYYFSIHLLYASAVGVAAWGLTTIPGANATTKYWMWVVTAFNFAVPVGAMVDRFWGTHFTWAKPIGAIGGPVWEMTQGRIAVVLALVWIAGALAMAIRLFLRLRSEFRQGLVSGESRNMTSRVTRLGIPVAFDSRHSAPAVDGVIRQRILLPVGIDQILNQQELDAVLLHEMTHARRRDNLIRLLFEVSLCALWFHPLIWFAGTRMALYRELSCDESVIRHAHGKALVRALVKLATPREATFLRATASSHLSHRLARLAGQAQDTHRAPSLLLIALFTVAVAVGVYGTIAHTACCFVLKH